MLEEVKETRRDDSIDGRLASSDDELYGRRGGSSPERPVKRLNSPPDAFKEVFNEYGAKLSPDLMRLQLEGDLAIDADGPLDLEKSFEERAREENESSDDDREE